MTMDQVLDLVKKEADKLFKVDSGLEIYYVYAATQEKAMAKAKVLGAKEIKSCEYLDLEAGR